MNVLDLFSGIGGFSLGLERAGMTTVAFCEIEPFCRRVLAKHWPGVPIYEDVRTLTAERLRADGISVDVICGGFPCQDISFAGKGAGIEGERSGLWSEYARIIGEVRPRFVVVENVAALLGRGLDRVLGDLASLGFDAEWHCIPASAVGAPHRRDRLWIVAHTGRQRGAGWRKAGDVARAAGTREVDGRQRQRDGDASHDRRATMANADESRLEGWLRKELRECACEWASRADDSFADVAHPLGELVKNNVRAGERPQAINATWRSEPDMGRVAHGVPARVDRLRGLGNAVVPQIPEIIGRAILASFSHRMPSSQTARHLAGHTTTVPGLSSSSVDQQPSEPRPGPSLTPVPPAGAHLLSSE